jgi:hypothetical protein
MIDVCKAFSRLVLNGMCRDVCHLVSGLDNAAIPVFAQCIMSALKPSLSTLRLNFQKDTSEESIRTASRSVADGCPPGVSLYLYGPVPKAVLGTLPTVEDVYINDDAVRPTRPKFDPQELHRSQNAVAKRRRVTATATA